MVEISNLRDYAKEKGIELAKPKDIVSEATQNLTNRYGYTPNELKANFDWLLGELEKEAYSLYQEYERKYVSEVLEVFVSLLISKGEIRNLGEVGSALSANFSLLDKFFLSLTQGRRSRAGSAFESFHNNFFRQLGYPFSEQPVINGKPDFVLPSKKHYLKNAPDCIVFTAKRTLRERWKQVVTEGTRSLGFYLATIDESISEGQLAEMLKNKIVVVCPQEIKSRNYGSVVNVVSFQNFFRDHLDPAMERWRENGVLDEDFC